MAEDEPLEAEYIHDTNPETELAIQGSVLPTTIYLLPVFERPFFPAQAAPVIMDEKPWLTTLEAIGESEQHMAGLVMVKTANRNNSARMIFTGLAVLSGCTSRYAQKEKCSLLPKDCSVFASKNGYPTNRHTRSR